MEYIFSLKILVPPSLTYNETYTISHGLIKLNGYVIYYLIWSRAITGSSLSFMQYMEKY